MEWWWVQENRISKEDNAVNIEKNESSEVKDKNRKRKIFKKDAAVVVLTFSRTAQ